MIKTILSTQPTNHYHPALGPLFKVTFTDNTSNFMYAETFFDQVESWEPEDSLEGESINLDQAFVYEEPIVLSQ